jgi:hypothetical protein
MFPKRIVLRTISLQFLNSLQTVYDGMYKFTLHGSVNAELLVTQHRDKKDILMESPLERGKMLSGGSFGRHRWVAVVTFYLSAGFSFIVFRCQITKPVHIGWWRLNYIVLFIHSSTTYLQILTTNLNFGKFHILVQFL